MISAWIVIDGVSSDLDTKKSPKELQPLRISPASGQSSVQGPIRTIDI